MDLTSNTSIYVLISKKYLTRYVLTYEVLPLYLCYKVNGTEIFNKDVLTSLITQREINDKDIILELKTLSNNNSYVTFSDIINISFQSQDDIDDFFVKSYENYDVNELSCSVLPTLEAESNSKVMISPPPLLDKYSFSERMAYSDAVVGLVHHLLLSRAVTPDILQFEGSVENLTNLLLATVGITSSQKKFASKFLKLCTQYNIDNGWDPKEVVEAFEKLFNSNPDEIEDVTLWITTINQFLSGQDINLLFTDDRNITLRATTLILLNPEIHNLEAIKVTLAKKLGERVYELAIIFAKSRTGYSYLSAKERALIGPHRPLLQALNARTLNELKGPFSLVDKVEDHQEVNEKVNDPLIVEKCIFECAYLTKKEDEELGTIFSINGIKPMAGFNLNLVHQEYNGLMLRIIDFNDAKGMEKFKGQLTQKMISVQRELPDSSRFEVYDSGVFLKLPLSWTEECDLKENLKGVFRALVTLKLEKKNSAITD